jgi:hypothetical protein
MVRIGILSATLMLITGVAARAQSAVPITECENITEPGDYVLANDLVLTVSNPSSGGGGDCLTISSPHVNVNMAGWAITVSCPSFPGCVQAFGPVDGIGIDILSGAERVSIRNGSVEDFLYGIVGAADKVFVNHLSTNAVYGITLTNVNHSAFTDISYTNGPGQMYAVGWMASVSGGSYNKFASLQEEEGGVNRQGLIINNSSHNHVYGARISFVSGGGAGPGILLTQNSDHNSVVNNSVLGLFGNGIEVDLGSEYNFIEGNTVGTLSPSGFFDMLDQNPYCGRNMWTNNSFATASPASCIK